MPKAASSSASATNSAGETDVAQKSNGFPPSRRILRKVEFKSIYDQGARSGCRFFSLFVVRKDLPAPARIGITVTKKIGNAIIRNRAKRLFREVTRNHWDLLPDGFDLVIHARRAMVACQYAEIEAEFVRLLPHAIRRAGRG